MKVFIIGGCNTVVNALLQKFNKEGLKLYVLTGSHQYHNKYKHVYEQYHFSYENNCIKEVFESVPAARVSVGQGSLLILWRRAAGLPEFEA